MIRLTILLISLCCLLTGCNESQIVQDRPVYGNGDLSPEYVAMFGDDNGSRLNFIQEQEINKLRANVYGFSHTDKDGKVTTGAGLIERVKEFEGLLARIEKLEEPDPSFVFDPQFYPLAIEGDE